MDFFYTEIENSGPATARIGIKGHAPLSQFLNSSFILQFRHNKKFLFYDNNNLLIFFIMIKYSVVKEEV